MNSRRIIPTFALFALAFAGCESGRSTRIQEKSAAYAMLTEEQKARVSQGNIGTGDSADAVYIALGKPNSVTTRPSEQGEVTVWTYKNFVVGEEMSTKIILNQPNQRMAGTPATGGGGGGRTGPSSFSTAPSRGTPQGMTEAMAETITLYVDLFDNRVIGLRSDR